MEPNLKHIRQMGSPTEENRIYIENAAYARVHEEDYAKQRVFIFMGHTECKDGCYITFVEAAIPVRDLTFSQNIPCWNTHAWSDIFREIKRSYENSIIVGWAMDCKGFAPRMTAALEAVHSEQFGGAHQVLLLMDSLEGEEYFYQNRGNHLQQKSGFYIYYARELHQIYPAEVTVEVPPRESMQSIPVNDPPKENKKRSYAMVAAVAMLVVLLGLSLVQGRISLTGVTEAIQAMSEKVKTGMSRAEVLVSSGSEEAVETESSTETLHLIPIEEVPAGEIVKLEEETQAESQTETQTEEQPETQEEAPTETQAEPSAVEEQKTYIVQSGDTLTGISVKLYGSNSRVQEIAELNQLDNSDDIREGQKLLLP
jgi:LysM repeat protein